jgi:hypothetical protein
MSEVCEKVITALKEVYGKGIENTLEYCKELTKCDDDFFGMTRFIILAIKLYPATLGYDMRINYEALENELKNLDDIDNNAQVKAKLNLTQEYIQLLLLTFKDSFDKEPRVGYTDPKDILYEGGYIAKITGEKARIIEYLGENDNITIPDTINGIPVVAINDYAFCGKHLKQAVIPSGVEIICESAFARSELTNITLPDTLIEIGKKAFECNNLANVDIPQSVIIIGDSAFNSNKLVKIKIPSGVKCISSNAFQWNEITKVELEEGITVIEHGAFYHNCIENLVIPKSVTTIGSSVFMSNPLSKIYLPGNTEMDSWGCAEGDIYKAYKRNRKNEGFYEFKGGHWRFIKDTEKCSDWEIKIHKEMEELAIQQDKAIEDIKMSKEGRRLSSLQRYFSNPIPKEIWDEMPDKFRDYIRSEILDGSSWVSFMPASNNGIINCETITVSHGPLAARGYIARTGECFMMS